MRIACVSGRAKRVRRFPQAKDLGMGQPTKAKGRAARTLGSANQAWVLVHVEYMGCTLHPDRDRMLMHVSSTRRGALARARKLFTSSAGWWELYEFHRDETHIDDDELSGQWPKVYLDHRGRIVRAPPIQRALKNFQRARAREIAEGVLPGGAGSCAWCAANTQARAPQRSKRRGR